MSIPPDLYEKISHLVAENRVNSAIELLEAQLPVLRQNNPEQYHAALVLMQDFNDIQERKINGLLVAEAETNSFSFRLLEFSRKLGRKFTPPPPPPVSPDPLRVAQPDYTAPPRRPATGPVNAKPGTRPGQSSGGGGITFGKLVLYGLAGLGVLVFIGLLIDLGGEDYEDPADFTSQAISPTGTNPNALPPKGNQSVTMDNLPGILGNSYWYGNVMGDLYFDETGSLGSYHGGNSSLSILSAANGFYFGTFSEPRADNYGTLGFVISDDRQDLTINTLDQNGYITSSLYQKRQ